MMKGLRRIFSVFLAAALAVGCSVTALAANWTVSTSEEMEEAFRDTDDIVTITMTGNITMLAQLEGKEGQTYIINGKAYVLEDVQFTGAGNVTVNADIANSENRYDAISAAGTIHVTVNGDVTSTRGDAVNGFGDSVIEVTGNVTAKSDGIYAQGNSNITVNGDIQSGGNGIYAQEDCNVTVNGDITAGTNGAAALDDSNITVNGDITADLDGAVAYNDATVTVTGDITAGDDGVEAADAGTVTVTGNVTGEDSGIYARDEAYVTVDGNVAGADGYPDLIDMTDPGAYSDGGMGVDASGSATVTVTGDVKGGEAYGTFGYGGTGVYAGDESTVEVGGNVTGGGVTADPSVEPNGNSNAQGGSGVYMDSTATVKAGGNVTGGDVNANGGEAGSGTVIVSLREVNEGGGTIVYGNGEETEEQEQPKLGSLTVLGTIMGGKALTDTAKAGAAVYFQDRLIEGEYDDLMSDPTIGSDTDVSDAARHYAGLARLAQQMLSEEELFDLWTQRDLILFELLGVAVPEGYAANDPTMEAFRVAVNERIAQMSEEEQDQFFLQWYNKCNPVQRDRILEKVNSSETYAPMTVWSVSGANGGKLAESTFGEAAAMALLQENADYIIRVQQPEHGTITVDKDTAQAGETVTVTVKVEDGYQVDSVSDGYGKLEKNADGTYSFQVPVGGTITVSAVISKIPVQNQEEEPKSEEQKKGTGPATGDTSSTGLWIALAVTAGVAMGGAMLLQKKKTQ